MIIRIRTEYTDGIKNKTILSFLFVLKTALSQFVCLDIVFGLVAGISRHFHMVVLDQIQLLAALLDVLPVLHL